MRLRSLLSCSPPRPWSARLWRSPANRTGMNKRLEKRHKRQVARSKQRVKLSEPDVRTPEQLSAAREASRAVSSVRNDPRADHFTPSVNRTGRAEETPAKADTES